MDGTMTALFKTDAAALCKTADRSCDNLKNC